MKKLLTTLFAATLATAMFAQEGKPPCPPPQGGNPPPPPQECKMQKDGKRCPKEFRQGPDFKKIQESMELLKKKYPAEMAEIDALRKEAMEKNKAAAEKFADLAEKENLDLPCVKMRKKQQKMKEFFQKNEKELKEIAELGKTDPKAAHQKFMELAKKDGVEFGALRRGMKDGQCPMGPKPGNMPPPPPPQDGKPAPDAK